MLQFVIGYLTAYLSLVVAFLFFRKIDLVLDAPEKLLKPKQKGCVYDPPSSVSDLLNPHDEIKL